MGCENSKPEAGKTSSLATSGKEIADVRAKDICNDIMI